MIHDFTQDCVSKDLDASSDPEGPLV